MVAINGVTIIGAASLLLQCVTAAPPSRPKTTRAASSIRTSVKASATRTASVTAPSSTTGACAGTFSPISAQAWVNAINPGWNLGNSLDATPGETSWNNAAVTADTFDVIKASGFKSVRVPVTYAYHYAGAVNTGTGPSWTIDPAWLQRVSDILDQITSRGLYAVVNVHHDSWEWADVTKAGANFTQIEEKFYRTWVQAATKFACKSSLVAFETINEPPANTADDGARINTFNNLFLKAINEAKGFNPQRVVNLVGGGQDSIKTSQWFKRPDTTLYKNPWAIQYHYYSPYDYIFSAWGKTTWGSDADKAALDADFANIRNNFTDVPLLIGEYAASPVMTESAARWKYYDFLIRTATKYNTATILWDNGNDLLDRKLKTWRDPTTLNVLINAQKGIMNSLPDSTVDGSATQFSSAYIFHKIGDPVTDQTLPFLFNGNAVKAIKNGATTLAVNKDYTVSTSAITFKSAFLKPFDTAEGVKANLTVSFSAGADVILQVVQWAPPTISTPTIKAVNTGSDLTVPITFAGLHKPAAVRTLKADGTYLVDDWTQYLPELQRARATFGNQFRWDWGLEGIQVTSGAIQAVLAAGQNVTFMVEAYPRVPGNNVNFTMTV